MKTYGVVIMDIVNSRKIKDRNEFQELLCNNLNDVSNMYQDILVAPITIVLGDEWEIITREPCECYNLIHEIQQRLWIHNIQCYAGIGIGHLSTKEYNDVRIMDGPCFHYARQAIQITKCNNYSKNKEIYSKSNKVFFISVEDGNSLSTNEVAVTCINNNCDNSIPIPKVLFQDTINTLIENTEILKSKMTKDQKLKYINYKKYKSYRNMVVHNILGVKSVSTISQSLNSSEYFSIQNNHEVIKELLKVYCSLYY